MSHFVIACYAPKPEKEQELLALVRGHIPYLKNLNMVTERPPLVLRNRQGTIIEAFEWRSPDALEEAHLNPDVQDLWKRFEEVCDYQTLDNLPEAKELFAHFEILELN